MICCAFCYAKDVPLKACSKCNKRMHCSRTCQIKDWKTGQNHKYFCGKTGELNHDFEIKATVDKGLGMFALRDFSKNEFIIAERPLLSKTGKEWNPFEYTMLKDSEKEAFKNLAGNSLVHKYDSNKFGGNYEIYALISRINHDCIGNASYIRHRGAMVDIAKRNIKAAEEITHAYVHITALLTREEQHY